MEQALKLIIAKSPNAMREAITTLRALSSGSPVVQQRYNHTVDIALNDPQAEFTLEERALIADNLAATGDATRDFLLRVRLTDAERVELETVSSDAGMSMSEYVRRKLFP
jgi:hypothetical protein